MPLVSKVVGINLKINKFQKAKKKLKPLFVRRRFFPKKKKIFPQKVEKRLLPFFLFIIICQDFQFLYFDFRVMNPRLSHV